MMKKTKKAGISYEDARILSKNLTDACLAHTGKYAFATGYLESTIANLLVASDNPELVEIVKKAARI
jgi:hypothetical protein